MKTYLLCAFLSGISIWVNAQQSRAYAPAAIAGTGFYNTNPFSGNDPEDKDLSVLTGILSKLIQQEFNNGDTAINMPRVSANYIPGSGVLFTIAQRMPFYSRPMALGVAGRAFAPERYGLTTTGQSADVVVLETPKPTAKPGTKNTDKAAGVAGTQINPAVTTSPKVITSDSLVIYQGRPAMVYNFPADGAYTLYSRDNPRAAKVQDSIFEAKMPRMKKVMERFLSEYSILLTKLKPEDKIWVNWTVNEDNWGVDQGRMACELSSRVVKQDMLDLRSGKLDAKGFTGKIQYSVTHCAQRVTNPEVEIFTAILERLYARDISQNLVQFGAIQSEVIGGLGYVFKLNFSPNRNAGFVEARPDAVTGIYTIQQNQNKEIPKEEMEKMINTFKADFPKQLLEYSRVLKGLQAGEILKVDVNIGEYAHLWRNAEGGKRYSYTIPQTLIRDYDSGKLKLEDAVKQIQVEEK